MKQKELLQKGIEILEKANVEDNFLKARLLIEYVLNQSREKFLMNEMKEVEEKKQIEYLEKLEEMTKGKPIQYITHKQYFMGIPFYVNENVLIPQPDTEVLVEKTIELISQMLKNKKRKITILDIGTGSGAIAVSIASYMQKFDKDGKEENSKIEVEITASDISKQALEVAKKNAQLEQVHLQFIESDLFEKLKGKKIDIIVSNPPYIETDIIPTLSKEVQNEPILALDGGIDGLNIYRKILKEAHNYLEESGFLVLEIGYNQGQAILELASDTNWNLATKSIIQDLGKNERVVVLQEKVSLKDKKIIGERKC